MQRGKNCGHFCTVKVGSENSTYVLTWRCSFRIEGTKHSLDGVMLAVATSDAMQKVDGEIAQ